MFQLIRNYNINEIEDYQGTRPASFKHFNVQQYGYKRVSNYIEFYTTFICCPCIYYVKKDDLFAYSFDPDLVIEFAKENNIELTDTYDNLKYINSNVKSHIKTSVLKRYKYNLNYIEGWKKVQLFSDGTFLVEDYNLKPFTKSIIKNRKDLVKFFNKYQDIVNYEIDNKTFLPTLTGGLDSRAFIGYYKNRVSELEGYFQTPVKQDGKNNVAHGALEVKLANRICNAIGLKDNMITDLGEYNTISGFFNENAEEYDDPNDFEYITKVIQHGWDNSHQYRNKITPYMDDDYLMFKQEGERYRIMFLLYMVPELINYPFISGVSLFNKYPEGFCFTEGPINKQYIKKGYEDVLKIRK